MGVHELPEARRRAALVLDEAQEPERMDELRSDHARKAGQHAAVDARGNAVLMKIVDEPLERPIGRVGRRSRRPRASASLWTSSSPPVRNAAAHIPHRPSLYRIFTCLDNS